MSLSLILHRAVYGLLTKKIKTHRIGVDAAWNLELQEITEKSFVISAGAGKDISFELDLVARTGCRLVLVDPSPTGCNTVANIKLPDGMAFEPVALSNQTGYISLAKPLDMLEVLGVLILMGKATKCHALRFPR